MKTTILISEGRTQLVLHPQSKHDKSVLNMLSQLPNTHRRSLYDRAGGFTMFDSPGRDFEGKELGTDLMIVFDTQVDMDKTDD